MVILKKLIIKRYRLESSNLFPKVLNKPGSISFSAEFLNLNKIKTITKIIVPKKYFKISNERDVERKN